MSPKMEFLENCIFLFTHDIEKGSKLIILGLKRGKSENNGYGGLIFPIETPRIKIINFQHFQTLPLNRKMQPLNPPPFWNSFPLSLIIFEYGF